MHGAVDSKRGSGRTGHPWFGHSGTGSHPAAWNKAAAPLEIDDLEMKVIFIQQRVMDSYIEEAKGALGIYINLMFNELYPLNC